MSVLTNNDIDDTNERSFVLLQLVLVGYALRGAPVFMAPEPCPVPSDSIGGILRESDIIGSNSKMWAEVVEEIKEVEEDDVGNGDIELSWLSGDGEPWEFCPNGLLSSGMDDSWRRRSIRVPKTMPNTIPITIILLRSTMSAIPLFVRQNGILGLLMWHTGWSSLVSAPWNGYGSYANTETFELLSKCNGRREIGESL